MNSTNTYTMLKHMCCENKLKWHLNDTYKLLCVWKKLHYWIQMIVEKPEHKWNRADPY